MDVLALSEVEASQEMNDPPPASTLEDRPPGETENKFQKAISAWRGMLLEVVLLCLASADSSGIDLSSLMPQLDSTASELVAHQRDALLERKELAQKTKDFRKLEDSAKLTEYKSILKGLSGFFPH